ncbi:MAG: hypothetical protein ACLFV2_02385 [Desulfurivibrionaceae bacterium]
MARLRLRRRYNKQKKEESGVTRDELAALAGGSGKAPEGDSRNPADSGRRDKKR